MSPEPDCPSIPAAVPDEPACAVPHAVIASDPSFGTLGRQAIFRDTAQYAGATYVSRALAAVRSIIIARSLGPELYGFWGTVSLVMSFGHYLHGGVQDMVVREIPTFRSQGKLARANASAQLGFSWLLGIMAVVVCLFWSVAALLPAGTPGAFRLGWAVAGIVLPLELLFNYEEIVGRAQERYGDVSRGLIVTLLFSVLLTAWLLPAFRLPGLFITVILTLLVGCSLLHRGSGYAWRWRWSWPMLRAMLRAGWPVLTMVVVLEAMGWIDRLIVVNTAGLEGLGIYGLAALLAEGCVIFPKIFSRIVEPMLYAQYARQGHAVGLRDHCWFTLRTLAYVMPVILALADLVVPIVIRRLLPAYTGSIPVARLLLWGAFFMGMAASTRPMVIAMGQQRRVLVIYGLAIAVNTVLSYGLAVTGLGLIGVAWGTIAAYALCSVLLVAFVLSQVGCERPEVLRRLGWLGLPMALAWVGTATLPVWLTSLAWMPLPAVELLRAAAILVFGWAVFIRLRAGVTA